jgi:cytochrome c-type biogenesis protein CcmH
VAAPAHSTTLARRRPVGAAVALGLLVALVAAAVATASSATTGGRASLPAIERQVMCTVCKIPLNIAQSPEADRERAFIQSLIDRGQTTAQIKRALVSQYGPSVLATPTSHGFGLVAYLVPVAAAVLGIALLVVLLPRWRRRERQIPRAAPALSAEERDRLDADLRRFRG